MRHDSMYKTPNYLKKLFFLPKNTGDWDRGLLIKINLSQPHKTVMVVTFKQIVLIYQINQ